jgi:hypothetical protein
MSEQYYNCTTTSTIPVHCVNPIQYFLEEAKKLSDDSDNQISLFEAINGLLDRGMVVSDCKMCCPDCTSLEYYLGSIETYLKYLELVPNNNDVASQLYYNCCVNVSSSIEEWLKYWEVLEGVWNFPTTFPTCCNGFSECVNEIFKYRSSQDCGYFESHYYDLLIDKGIVEQNSINGESQLCVLFNFLKEYTECGCFSDILNVIIDKGLMIYCNFNLNHVFIGSAEAYLDYRQSLIPNA